VPGSQIIQRHIIFREEFKVSVLFMITWMRLETLDLFLWGMFSVTILMVWYLTGYPYSAAVSESDLSSYLSQQDFAEHWCL
jgi:hypothetical protein